MNRALLFCAVSTALTWTSHAQTLTSPVAEGVYGGRVHAITSYSLGSDSSRIIITTESANTMFYADVQSDPVGSPAALGSFQTVPGADDDDGFGGNINKLTSHENSGYAYFISAGQVYRVHPTGGSATSIYSGNANHLFVKDDYLFVVEGSDLHFGMLDASGNYTASTASPVSIAGSGLSAPPLLDFDPVTDIIWVYVEGTSPELYMCSDAYHSLSSSSSFTNVSLSGMIKPGVDYRTFGVAPDQKIYIMGNHYPSGSNVSDYFDVAWSSDSGATWTHYKKPFSGPFASIAGPNIDFAGSSSQYYIYNGDNWNSSSGDSTAWQLFGNPGGFHNNNRANSGAVLVDPTNDSLVYFTTNVAFGFSSNRGSTARGFNRGLTAVQVNDMDMTSDFNTGWVASKSGLRKVSNYKSTAQWSDTKFPNGDGSPYFSIDMANDDTNTVYAGNVRIYKTTNSGINWRLVFDPTSPSGGNIFAPHSTQCYALEVNPFDTAIVMAGFASDFGSDNGALFMSSDGGQNWAQVLVEVSSPGRDVDVYDIVFTDSVTAYIGVFYDLSSPQGRSIYKVDISGGSPAVSQEMNASGTAVGTSITASIFDLEVSPGGDTIFAAGTDAGINHPICYFKDLAGTNLWEVISTSGFPSGSNEVASAVTVGAGVVFCSVNSDIYTYDLSTSTAWSLGYSYPTGTNINFMFYDELLVGTGTGLYAQYLNNAPVDIEEWARDGQGDLLLYPNPAADYIRISHSDPDQKLEDIEIRSLSGQLLPRVISEQSVSEYLLNLKHLKSGAYLIRVHTNKGWFSAQFIKQ